MMMMMMMMTLNNVVRGAENDGGQQSGAASGRMRDDGKRNLDLLRQNGNFDDEPHDCSSELHLWYVYVIKHVCC